MVAGTLNPGTNLICKTKLDHFRVKDTIIGNYETDYLIKSMGELTPECAFKNCLCSVVSSTRFELKIALSCEIGQLLSDV